MSNPLPGSDVLGYGFNILGPYSTESVTTELFIHRNQDVEQWTYQPTNITYTVPDNTAVIDSTNSYGSAHIYTSQQDFQSYFAAQAGVSGSYGGFSGEFDAAYSSTFDTDETYYYGFYQATYNGWTLSLEDESEQWLSPSFIDDPMVRTLPTTFTPDNQSQFFTVLQKYGTHFVDKVTVGGSLYYFTGVETTYSSDLKTVQANIDLEYHGALADAGAKAKADWQQLGTSWTVNRVVSVNAVGGDTEILNALSPEYGQNNNSAFTDWLLGVMTNPSVMNFHLRPLSLLLPENQMDAMSQALNAYMNGSITVGVHCDYIPGSNPADNQYDTSFEIMANGSAIWPTNSPTPPPPFTTPDGTFPVGGFQVAQFDPISLDVLMSTLYYVYDPTDPNAVNDLWNEISTDVSATSVKGYLVAVAAFGVPTWLFPRADVAQWLESCGAQLQQWSQNRYPQNWMTVCDYAMIGQLSSSPGSASESFTFLPDMVNSPGDIDLQLQRLVYAEPVTRAKNRVS